MPRTPRTTTRTTRSPTRTSSTAVRSPALAAMLRRHTRKRWRPSRKWRKEARSEAKAQPRRRHAQEAASSAARTQGGAKTLAAVDDAVVSGASHPRPLPPSPLSAEPAMPGREPRSSRGTPTSGFTRGGGGGGAPADQPALPTTPATHRERRRAQQRAARNNSLRRQSSYQTRSWEQKGPQNTDDLLRTRTGWHQLSPTPPRSLYPTLSEKLIPMGTHFLIMLKVSLTRNACPSVRSLGYSRGVLVLIATNYRPISMI